nr:MULTISPECIES: cytochrome P450 [unclassified Frankia]
MSVGNASSSAAPATGNPMENPAFLAAPQAIFPALRARGAVAVGDRAVLLTRNADIATLLTNPEIFSSGVGVTETGAKRPLIPLQIDPPKHREYRKILDPLFSPQRMKEMEGPISELARGLIDTIAAQDEVDFVQRFSTQFPSQVFLTLLGLPLDELPTFLTMKDGFIRPESITGQPRGHEDSIALLTKTSDSIYEYFDAVIADRRANPGEDIVSRFLETEVEGARLSHEDIVDICFLFLVAGLDTVSASLDCMMLHLATHPDRRRALVNDPSLIPNAVEELLRWESPVMMVARVATQDTEIAGCPVSKGMVVTGLLGAANTDEQEITEPDVVRFDRATNRHIAFGRGPHRCLGSHLARLELRIALREWHARIPEYRVPDGFQPAFTTTIRSLVTLPLQPGQSA